MKTDFLQRDNTSFDKYSARSACIGEKPVKLSFGTVMKEDEIIDKIFKEQDFLNEIPSPRCIYKYLLYIY